ncbi:hypothetical protein GGR50DRAFT_659976 [Xylaria sp. CBS 124048]|nr:hypothetical protein GGR50DRAFT_659976 [Xylaria sp. CBS 124048]
MSLGSYLAHVPPWLKTARALMEMSRGGPCLSWFNLLLYMASIAWSAHYRQWNVTYHPVTKRSNLATYSASA